MSFHWTRSEDYFGGMSGLEVWEDGTRFLAIGDRGQVIEGRIRRENGRIVAMEAPWIGGLKMVNGRRVGRKMSDSEGLARAEDGRFFVSFEGFARVWAYAAVDAPAQPLPRPRDFHALGENAGLEALAVDDAGRLYAIPEEPPGRAAKIPVYRFADGAWEVFDRLERGALHPTGADVGPDGRLYLLERRWHPPLSFSARVRRFEIGANGLGPPETLLEIPRGRHDNLEAISVWRRPDGRLTVTLMSDDNFLALQKTEVVEYDVPG